MKNAKHTPGPWRVGDAGHAVFGPKDSGMYPNAPVTVVQKIVSPANARLIAAAPELLEALEVALKSCSGQDDFYYKTKALMAKSRGES